MNCKNCHNTLGLDTNFCEECGARIIHERITIKKLIQDIFTNYLGWDNKFFLTTKNLIVRPGKTINEYLGGTRKKYMNPFGYYGLIVAVSFLFFSQFESNFIAMNSMGADPSVAESAFELGYESTGSEPAEDDIRAKKAQARYAESINKSAKGILKYFNVFSFLLLPFYGFLAYIVYGKRYNYGEHLVIGTYAQGVLSIVSFIIFFLVFIFGPRINLINIFLTMGFYLYIYQQLNEQNWKQVIISFFKFIGFLLLGVVIIMVLGIIIALIYAFVTKKILM